MTDGRALPEFFRTWRQDWTPPHPWDPVDYLNQDDALRAVLMAQWLFCPEFFEYRGGYFLAHSPTQHNVGNWTHQSIDNWLQNPAMSIPLVEEVLNRVKLWDVFDHCQLDGLERNLEELAESLALCWRGALAARFPDRRFVVLAEDTANGVYGPGVTFFQDSD